MIPLDAKSTIRVTSSKVINVCLRLANSYPAISPQLPTETTPKSIAAGFTDEFRTMADSSAGLPIHLLDLDDLFELAT